jgi:phage virion morphogenesis protein
MSDAHVSFDLKEVGAVGKMLGAAPLAAADRAQLLRGIGTELEDSSKERFDTQKTPDGDTWKEIAEKTRAYYMRQGWTAHSTLVLEGLLRDSLTHEIQGGGWAVLVGATMEYAAVHQFGWPERNIPARPYLGVSEEDAKVLESIAAEYLAEGMR